MTGRRTIATLGATVLAAVLLGVVSLWGDSPDPARAPAPAVPAGNAEPHAPGVLPPPPPEEDAREADPAPPVSAYSAESRARSRTVTVLGPDDRPIEGVVISLVGYGQIGVTGPDGTLTLPEAEPGAVLRLSLSGASPERDVDLKPGEDRLRLPKLLPLIVEVVSGATGETIWNAKVSLVREHGPDLPLRWRDDRLGLPIAPVRPGHRESLEFRVELPRGFVLVRSGNVKLAGTISRFAERVHATVVAWPVVPVRVRVEEPDGALATGAHVRITGSWGFAATRAASERFVVGVPAIPGEHLRARAVLGDRAATSSPARIRGPVSEVFLRVFLPPVDNVIRMNISTSTSIGIGGGAGGAFRGRRGYRSSTPFNARLVVRVLRRDGSPARGAKVVLDLPWSSPRAVRTGEDGTLTLSGLAEGAATATVQEPGFLMGAPVEAELETATTALIEIREAEGSFLHVLVLDDEGLPARFAALEVRVSGKVPYTSLVDGVQHLNLHTDFDGRAALPHLPDGTVRVRARLGSRRAEAGRDRGGLLEIRLPPAK